MDTDSNLWPINAQLYSIRGHNRALPRRTTRPGRLQQDRDLCCHQPSQWSSELRRDGRQSSGKRGNLTPWEKAGQNSLNRLSDAPPKQSDFQYSIKEARDCRAQRGEGKGWGHFRMVAWRSYFCLYKHNIKVRYSARECRQRFHWFVSMSELDGNLRIFFLLTSSHRWNSESILHLISYPGSTLQCYKGPQYLSDVDDMKMSINKVCILSSKMYFSSPPTYKTCNCLNGKKITTVSRRL